MGQTLVFFRNDDVGGMTPSLQFVMNVLIDAAVPCHYQIVPTLLDEVSARALRESQQAHPDLVWLNQHGLRHAQTLRGLRRVSEFAGGRSFHEQREDIEAGRVRLREALGDSFSPDVFTPPCHKYDRETLRALGDLGFRTLSAGVRTGALARTYYSIGRALGRVVFLGKRVSYHLQATPERRIREVSVALDVHEDVDGSGRRIDKSAERLWAEFTKLRGQLSVVGVMLHHQACDTEEKREALRAFTARLDGDPSVRLVSIGDLQRGTVPSPV